MKGGPKSSLRPFLHRALQFTEVIYIYIYIYIANQAFTSYSQKLI